MQEFQNAGYDTGGALALAPQGLFGGLLGGPVGSAIGSGIGGLLGNAGLGGQIGQIAGGIGGSLLPFGTDPVSAAYAQQAQQQQLMQQLQQQQGMGQQLAPQGWMQQLLPQGRFGNLITCQRPRQLLPFGVEPQGVIPNLAQMAQHIQQLQQQLLLQQQQHQQRLAQLLAQQQQQVQPRQQGQIGPQGWVGNLAGQVGAPLGDTTGGIFGNSGLGSTIGGIADQAGQMLPFGTDQISADAQQAQLAQQQGMPQYSPQQTLH